MVKTKTLREYIQFLRAHNFLSEANVYNFEVVKIVCGVTGYTVEQVLDMPTKKVIEALIKAKNTLESIKIPEKQYDVVLTS